MSVLFLLAALVAAPPIWIADESVKVRPQAPPPSPVQAPRLRLTAAGGECQGGQIIVRGPVKALRAAAAPLRGSARHTAAVSLSRVATILLVHPSGPDGAIGEWPDALIPERDVLYREERNAFPIDVAAGRAQAIFVEACVERGAGPGRYAGSVRLSWTGGSAQVPIELRARAFDLPATPPLATAFGFSGWSAVKGHKQKPEANAELTRAYDLLALRRGITLFGGTQTPPDHRALGDKVEIDWASYDKEVAEFLDGTALPSGARWTSVELRDDDKLTRPQRRSYRQGYLAHFREHGWQGRLFIYVDDEPDEARLPEVERKAREFAEDVPEVRRLVTTALSDKLPSVNLYVTVVNCLTRDDKTCPRPVERARYAPALAKGAQLWWYQACMSHGCSSKSAPEVPILDPLFKGWPSYMIDAPATAARAMGALAFAQGVSGELYFDVVSAYDEGDPWKSQWAFGGNGDGTLYYPGTPERIGGKHDLPIESLRIVQISRALADNAYLSLCAQLGDPQLARSEAQALAPSVRGFLRDPHAYAAMRDRIGARIETLLKVH